MSFPVRTVLFIVIATWFAANVMSDSDTEFVRMGDCLLMQRDGTVTAVWDLPGAAAVDDALVQPDMGPVAPWNPVKSSRIARDW